MAILVDEKTKYIIQGITGKEGQRAAAFMRAGGSLVVGGVRPGKGGEQVDGVLVFNTVAEAVAASNVTDGSRLGLVYPLCSVIAVPPAAVKAAVQEAIDAGVKFIIPIAEGVPVHDTAWMLAYARARGSQVLGPNTVGVISPGKSKGGVIGGQDNRAYSPGSVGIISKSGGMTGETARLLTRAGLGQSTCVNIGGDRLIGTDFADALSLFSQDDETKAVVLFGEIGGTYEEQAAAYIQTSKFSKPVVAFISGASAERWRSVPLGHAGAVIEGSQGTRASKVSALAAAGVTIVDVHHEIVDAVQTALRP